MERLKFIMEYIIAFLDLLGPLGTIIKITIIGTIFYCTYYVIKTSPVLVGKKYERLVARRFERTLNNECIRNFIIPSKYTKIGLTEIDMFFISKKGIFALECKHRNLRYDTSVPHIGFYQDEWISDINMPNPFKQNDIHIKSIKDIIPNATVFNIVVVNFPFSFYYTSYDNRVDSVFSNDFYNLFEFEKAGILRLTKFNSLRFFKKCYNSLPDIYTKEEVKELYIKLKSSEANKEQKKKFKDYNTIGFTEDDILNSFMN